VVTQLQIDAEIFRAHFHDPINRQVQNAADCKLCRRLFQEAMPPEKMEAQMVDNERRKQQRHRTLKAGHIAFNRAGTIDCRVRNLSPIGACLEVASQVGIPDEFVLLIDSDHLKQICRVIWRKPTQLGVEFAAAMATEDGRTEQKTPA
jgi:hypothetical protein